MKYMQVEGLENRRLLTFIPFTPARGIPGAEKNVSFGCAVAYDHSLLFSRQSTQQTLELTRLSATGQFALPVGDLHIAALPDGSGALYARDFSNDTEGLVAFGHASPAAPSGDLKPVPGASYQSNLAVYPDGSFVIGYDTNQDPNGEPFDVVRVFGADGNPRTQPISLSKLLGDASLPVGGLSVQTISDGGFVAS